MKVLKETMTVPQYDSAGQKIKACSIEAEIFNRPKTNANLLKAAYEHYLASKRVNLAKTKIRSQVRGGGRKPWRQKGTGNARAGSIRSPIWRGGGITFGPTGVENYAKKLNKKAKLLALKQALTLKKTAVVCFKDLPTDGKTSTMAKLLASLKLNKKVLLIVSKPAEETRRAARNLKDVQMIEAEYLSVFKVLNADWLAFTAEGLERLQAHLGGSDRSDLQKEVESSKD